MSVKRLPDQAINKIAAGEVIKNPASVVKELVENALDAGSDAITVEIERGGFALIRIADNGSGMGRGDLHLSIERHATSKIQAAEDLSTILTMGFRGEALASIGAISKLKMVTAEEGKEHGYELTCLGGVAAPPSPAARSFGTTIEVRSLFYNVPARLKFQKSVGSSQSSITKLLTKFSLAHPTVRWRYLIDGREAFHLPAGERKERCIHALGKSCVDRGTEINFSTQDIVGEGWLGSPTDAKSNRLGQHLFVNQRAVLSYQISQAIYDGYGTRLGAGLHPMYVLNLTLPPDWIDVNVHPEKREIRLREEGEIQREVRRGVLSGFGGKREELSPPKVGWSFDPSFTFQEKREYPEPSLPFAACTEELPVVGLFASYLILEHTPLINFFAEEGIYIVDLEGAYARILYERFLRKEPLPLQPLLFPITLELTPCEKELLTPHTEEIKKMGIELRPFGDNAFIVESLTPDIEEGKLRFLLETLAPVFDQKLVEKEREKKLALSACYCARSQRKGWSLVEAKHTAQALLKTTDPYHCPKGKKTITTLSQYAIKRLFQKKDP